jgi:hypothetical protein
MFNVATGEWESLIPPNVSRHEGNGGIFGVVSTIAVVNDAIYVGVWQFSAPAGPSCFFCLT